MSLGHHIGFTCNVAAMLIFFSRTSWDWYKKGSNDDCLPDPAAKVKKIKDSTEIISQQSSGAPATAAAGVKRKSGASVGVHESGLAFLKKVKLEVAATAAAGHPIKTSSLAEEPGVSLGSRLSG